MARAVMQISVQLHHFLYSEQTSQLARIFNQIRDIGFWIPPFSFDNTNVLLVNKKRE
jgi:hypothetical protein